jgi:MoaA/NifB/PqqE/SkfB family radical SAM enzyme
MNISKGMAVRIAASSLWNMCRKRPLSVSFEITHACTANCWHCNWGGSAKETRLSPEGYAAIARELKPTVVNVSGGEPLSRDDVTEIVRGIARPGGLPWVVVVTNASRLTPELFLELKGAGMHQLSVSIDFPDDRHSEFRRIPGLFDRMSEVIPECVRIGGKEDVNLNCCITGWNYTALPEIVHLAERWGVSLNFSAYSALRVDDPRGLVRDDESKDALRAAVREVIDLKRAGKPVYNSERVLWRYCDFLCEGHRGGCRAGTRFLVVNPDGRLTPCAMVMAYFNDQATMRREFSSRNACGACYISTRANSEKSIREFLEDHLSSRIFRVSDTPPARS